MEIVEKNGNILWPLSPVFAVSSKPSYRRSSAIHQAELSQTLKVETRTKKQIEACTKS